MLNKVFNRDSLGAKDTVFLNISNNAQKQILSKRNYQYKN